MSKRFKIILAIVITFILCLATGIGVLAYYEFYGQYSAILNVDGTIKLDAFDVLYQDLRSDKDSLNKNTYGTTPENPYVIDNVTRLKNLIRLNNSGKLSRSKAKEDVEKYSDITNINDLKTLRGEFFKNTFKEKRESILSN